MRSWRGVMFFALAVPATMSLVACPGEAAPDAGVSPTLSVVAEEIFSPNCSANACHGGDGPVRGLKLDADDLHAALVDVESTVPGVRYVIPGDPDESLLYQVLIGDVDNIRQMPPNAPLDDDKIALLRAWIDEGADDN